MHVPPGFVGLVQVLLSFVTPGLSCLPPTMRLARPLIVGLLLCFLGMSWRAQAQLPPSMAIFSAEEIVAGACNANPVHLYGQSTQYTLNGTMMMARPLKKDGTYDDENKFALYVKSIIELKGTVEGQTPPRNCLTDSPVIRTLDLKSCSCSSNPYLREGPGYKDAGQELAFFDCADQPGFTFSLYMAIPNVTHSELYETTVPGSLYPNFTYTSPYVAQNIRVPRTLWAWVLHVFS